MKKHFLLFTLAVSLIGPAASAEELPQLSPLREDFVQALDQGWDYIPSPVSVSSDSNALLRKGRAALPALYDPRPFGLSSPVKNQASSGVCWTFASTACLESRLLLDDNSAVYDFSENHARHSLSRDTSDTDSEGNMVPNPWGYDFGVNDGGNFQRMMAYYGRWSGPVLESDDPYPTNGTANPRSLKETLSKQTVKHVTDMFQLPTDIEGTEAHCAKIKQAVLSYGAVFMGMYYTDAAYFNSSKTAYYCPSAAGTNHAVTIVGWDDTYSKSNFKAGAQPPNDGAFLIKNSHGTSMGDKGYFWLSYYDVFAGHEASGIAAVDEAGDYDNLYQYDPFGYLSKVSFNTDTAVFANRFPCTPGESLKAVSFYTTAENQSYTVYVSRHSNSLQEVDLTQVAVGNCADAGFHTISIPAQCLTGDSFSVAVQLKSADGSSVSIPLERNVSTTINGKPASYVSQATQNAGEGYFSPGLSYGWYDAATAIAGSAPLASSICLKAYTNDPPALAPVQYSISYTDQAGLPLNMVQAGEVRTNFELTNTTSDSKSLTAVSAVYRGGILSSLKMAEIENLSGAKTVSLSQQMQSGDILKSFVWDPAWFPSPAIASVSVLENGQSIKNPSYLQKLLVLRQGETASLNVLGIANGLAGDYTHRFTWENSKPAVASVSVSGRITALAPGETIVQAKNTTIGSVIVIVTN